MTLPEALRAIIGNTDLMAVLPGPRGEVPALFIGAGVTIQDVRSGTPRRYMPVYADAVSIEWSVIQISVVSKQAAMARAAAAKGEG